MSSDFSFPATLNAFLAGLRANNDKAWFEAHRGDYEAGFKNPAEAFCGVLEAELEAMDGRSYRAKVYRIHRDVRFSKDKQPYNSHLHIAFHAREAGAVNPGWFFGYEPDRLTVGAGVFGFEGDALDRFRRRVAGADGEGLAAALAAAATAGFDAREPDLKRVPSPYPADHPRADLLKRKSMSAWKDFPDPDLAFRPELTEEVMAAFGALRPVFEWLAAG